MNKPLILVADPEIARTVPGYGVHDSTGHRPYGNEPAIFEVGKPAKSGDPNSPAIVLKKGLHGVVWQPSSSLAVDRDLPVIPSVQAVVGAKPNAAVPIRKDGLNICIRQTLVHRNRGDSEIAKAIEAINCSDPNIALTILKKTLNEIARETVRPRKYIRPSLV